MTYGVVPIGGARETTLAIYATSDEDDFADDLEIDIDTALDNWPRGDCVQVRELPIYNIQDQREDTGVVFRNTAFGLAPAARKRRRTKHKLLLAAAASALAGGALTAVLWKRRK